jgi:hypothetical protein
VPTYLVEAYVPRSRATATSSADAVAHAAAELEREGVRVEHRRTTFLPGDETCFYLFEAASPGAVGELCQRAGLAHLRIVEAFET